MYELLLPSKPQIRIRSVKIKKRTYIDDEPSAQACTEISGRKSEVGEGKARWDLLPTRPP